MRRRARELGARGRGAARRRSAGDGRARVRGARRRGRRGRARRPRCASGWASPRQTEREIFTIALTAQINIEPARRDHDEATRERLVDLFGEPERWPATTHPFLWAHATALVPTFTGAAMFTLPVLSTFDLEIAAARYFSSLPDGEVPLHFHFSGSILLRGEDGRIQVVSVPWSCSATWRMPISAWREVMRRHYPGRSWVAAAGGHGRAADALPPRPRVALLRRLRRAHARARSRGACR